MSAAAPLVHHDPAPLPDTAWEDVEKEKVVSGTPRRAFRVDYTNAAGTFYAGLYECTAGAWKVAYEEDEFCTLIEGRVRLTDDKGGATEFAAPQSFTIPAGFRGVWEALSPVRKFFAVYEKAK